MHLTSLPSTVALGLLALGSSAWSGLCRLGRRLRADDRGEGVISAAIAVLVMAGIGALMWVGFKAMWEDTEAGTRAKVAEIGK